MGYVTPADVWVSDTWQGHKNRNPPSSEPGTDYATSYGTDLRVAGDGVVSLIDNDNGGGQGRRVSFNLDDGRCVSYLHLSSISCALGQRVSRGQTGLMRSGASGYGNDWYYGPHVHVSLWERPGMPYPNTIDFQLYVGDDAPPKPKPITPKGAPPMYIRATSDGQYTKNGYTYANDIGGHWRGISNLEGEGYVLPLARTQLPYADFSGPDLDLLFALNGVWEQNELDGSNQWGPNGTPLIGLGTLTGRMRYPGAAGEQGQWHDPYDPAPATSRAAGQTAPQSGGRGPLYVLLGVLAAVGAGDFVVALLGLLGGR